MAKNTSRRSFLRTVPVAAAAGFTLTDSLMALAQTAAEGAAKGEYVNTTAQPYKLWSQKDLEADIKALDAKPGDNKLNTESKAAPMQMILTMEKHKSATEFEWHEGRDHVLYILDGSTVYEIGGTPTGTKVMGPGEWHATGSTGSKSMVLGKGDLLLIPRGTLHKRSTEDSVTFLLISNPVPAKA